jgi:sugar lactone lactonase YvrE
MTRVSRLGPALAVALVAVLTSPTNAGTQAFPDRFDLPDGFLPEGIAVGPGPTAWFGSRADGDIYEVDLATGQGEVISEGPGTPSIGLKSDRRGRLFVAGGPAGDGRVVDRETGDVLASYHFTTDPSFVNDVVLTRDAAWFTDSMSARLYAVPLSPAGGLPDQSDFVTLPLTGDWVQGEGFGANGLTDTPDGDALLVVHSTSGELHRVDPDTGATQIVDLGDTLLTNGDGLLLDGRTLYAVQNRLNQVAVLELSRDGTSGTLVDTITSADFDVPTTVAAFGPWLYLPNARFTTPPTPETEYWVTRVPS